MVQIKTLGPSSVPSSTQLDPIRSCRVCGGALDTQLSSLLFFVLPPPDSNLAHIGIPGQCFSCSGVNAHESGSGGTRDGDSRGPSPQHEFYRETICPPDRSLTAVYPCLRQSHAHTSVWREGMQNHSSHTHMFCF